jgi:hypothetical protein
MLGSFRTSGGQSTHRAPAKGVQARSFAKAAKFARAQGAPPVLQPFRSFIFSNMPGSFRNFTIAEREKGHIDPLARRNGVTLTKVTYCAHAVSAPLQTRPSSRPCGRFADQGVRAIGVKISPIPVAPVARAATPAGPRVVSDFEKSARQPTLQAWRLAPRVEVGLPLALMGVRAPTNTLVPFGGPPRGMGAPTTRIQASSKFQPARSSITLTN